MNFFRTVFTHKIFFNKKVLTKKSINDIYLILLSPLLSYFRKIKFTENILAAIDLIEHFSKQLDHSVVLDRIIPYYLYILDAKSMYCSAVRSRAIVALNESLKRSKSINIDNMNIFSELIFDVLKRASKSESDLVRAAVAQTILSFSMISIRYLRAKHDYLKKNFKEAWKKRVYSRELAQYKDQIKNIILELINKNADPGEMEVCCSQRESLFPADLPKLCSFFRYFY